MPYLQEQRSQLVEVEGFVDWLGSVPTTGPIVRNVLGYSEAQYGWRSTGETQAAISALDSFSGDANWANSLSVAESLDRIERSYSHPVVRGPSAPVHDRDYSLIECKPDVIITETFSDPGLSVPKSIIQCPVWINAVTYPSLPSDADLRAVGGNLLRASTPTQPYSNMSQFFGELRQFGSGFSVPSTMPDHVWEAPGAVGEVLRFRQGGKLVGSGYLAGQFAWLPFFGEIIAGLEAMASSEHLLDQYLRDSSKLVRRTNERTTYTGASSVPLTISGSGKTAATPRYNTASAEGVTVQVGWIPTLGNSGWRLKSDNELTVSRVDSYRTSALWEYFAHDPEGNLGYLRSFAQKARLLLGDPLVSYKTLWELTPWTWFSDWFFNFGSFLSYQESVATDNLAARRACTVFESTINIVYRGEAYWTRYGSYNKQRPAHVTATVRRQKRRGGNPYDMGIDLSGFSTQKWFILGALGLAKAPGKPGWVP